MPPERLEERINFGQIEAGSFESRISTALDSMSIFGTEALLLQHQWVNKAKGG